MRYSGFVTPKAKVSPAKANKSLVGNKALTLGVLLILKLLFFTASGLQAQTGSIRGIVVDGTTNETLVGAAVVIQGTFTGVTTDFNGEFRLDNLQPGTYTLQISFISYDPFVVENIRVEAGRSVTVNVPLSTATQQLDGVAVVARRVQHTDVSLISSIRTANLVVSGVSAQQISRSQDRDASQVIRRVPGVTVIDNRFVVVRGLNERYNSVILNGLNAPSMEDDVRSFSFDVIPSGQLERMLVFKSPSAELPGDFAGGAIKVYTRSIPERDGFEARFTAGFEPGTTFNEFLGPERYKGHFTGFNTGAYDLPANLPDPISGVNDLNELKRLGNSFKNNWVPERNTALFNQSASLNGFFNSSISDNFTFGHFTSINYSNSYSFEEVNRFDYNAFNYVDNIALPIYWFNDNRFTQNIRLGVLHNYGFQISPEHTIEVKNLFNQQSSFEYIHRTGQDFDFGYFPSSHSFQQLYRTIYSGQVGGNHNFFNNLTEIDWAGGYSFTRRDMPDYKRYRSDLPELGGNPADAELYLPVGTAQAFFLGRVFLFMEESTYSGSVNLTQRFGTGGGGLFRPVIKAGLYMENKERAFDARNIGYALTQFDAGLTLRQLPINELFHPDNINSGAIRLDEQSNPNDSYQATSDLLAWYLSAQLPLTSDINLVAGLRMEDYTQTMVSATTTGPVNEVYQKTDFLPSLNLSYSINDQMLFRAAYGRTLNRPEFRERAPFSFYNFNDNLNRKGNIFLQDASINNFDLRWEWYPSASEMVNFGVFYKHFTNPIESSFEPGAGSGGAKNFSFTNAKSAYSYGVELDARKSLMGIFNTPFTDNLSVVLNAALITSNVEYGEGFSHGRDIENRPLQGQSPYIINTGLYYFNETTGIEASILYNTIGRRIVRPGFTKYRGSEAIDYGNIYEMPRDLVDLTISKEFNNNITVRVGVSDLLNDEVLFLQDPWNDGRPRNSVDPVIESYRPGRLFTFSVGFSL